MHLLSTFCTAKGIWLCDTRFKARYVVMSGLFSVDYSLYVFVLHLSQKLHRIHIISRQSCRRRMPSARPEYEDEHRLFLQGIMAKGVLNNKEVHALHEKVLKMCSIEMPEKRKDLIDLLAKNIRTINNEIEEVGLMIKKGVEEDTGESCFMLVNTQSRAVGGSKFLATKVQSQFSPAELDYLRLTPFCKDIEFQTFSRLLATEILQSEEKMITSRKALNLMDQVGLSSNFNAICV